MVIIIKTNHDVISVVKENSQQRNFAPSTPHSLQLIHVFHICYCINIRILLIYFPILISMLINTMTMMKPFLVSSNCSWNCAASSWYGFLSQSSSICFLSWWVDCFGEWLFLSNLSFALSPTLPKVLKPI